MASSARKQFANCSRLTALLMIFGLWAIGPLAEAQQASATVNGVVSDPSGAAIPGALIKLTNVNTAVERSTKANSDGAYALLNVTPGAYTLQASATGFAGVTQAQVNLEVNQTATFDFHLKVGETQTSLTVEASAAAVESSTSELGTVVSNRNVVELPLNGRNFTQLLTITPGVANVNRDQSGGGGGGFVGNAIGGFAFPAINGSRVRSNTFLLDGVNNLNTFLTTYNFQPIVDDIQEFKTQGHNDLAEYGGVTGGIISVVSKSGTNTYHGTLWEFLRNEQMDARGFFDRNRVPLRQNTFGVAAGGPIWIPKIYNGKNRTFFYAAYEGYRQHLSNQGGTLGPTDAMRGGDFSVGVDPSKPAPIIYDPFSTTFDPATNTYSRNAFSGNKIPASQMSPITKLYQDTLIPKAGALVNGNNIYIPTPSSTAQDSGSIRGDQYIRNSDQIMFRFSKYEQLLQVPNGPVGRQLSNIYGHNLTAHETHTFGPTAVVDVYFGRNYGFNTQRLATLNETAAFTKSVLGLGVSPNFSNLNGNTYAPSLMVDNYVGMPYARQQDTGLADVWQFGGNFTKIFGKHTLKFGADFQTNNFTSPITTANEGFTVKQTAGLGANQGIGGDPWASFLLGVPGNAVLRVVKEVNKGGKSNAFYVQDQWKLSPRLTVNIGFRYEYKIWPVYGEGRDLYTGNANPVTGQYILTALPPNCSASVGAPCIPNGIYAANGPSPYSGLPPHVIVTPHSNHSIFNNDFGDWSGRLGLAYRINDKTAARAGYGRFYDMWGAVTQLAQNFGGNWPAVQTISNSALNQTTITAPVTDPLNLGGGGGIVYPRVSFDQVSQWMVDPNFKTSYMDQWNFGIQREMPGNAVLDVNYVGSVGRRLDWGPIMNVAQPGPGDPQARQPFPYMNPQWFDMSVGNSRYNSLQVSFNKRATKNVAFLVSYTLAKSVDDGCSLGANCNVSNPYNRAADTQVSDLNQTHVFSASFTAHSPFGKGANKAVSVLAGGWQLNGIVQMHSGAPYTVTASNGILNNGGYNQERANVSGDPNSCCKTPAQWFNTATFSNPAPYTYGNSLPNLMRMDWGRNLDLSIFRQFHTNLGEARYFEFRAEGFNVFNNVVFGQPNSGIGNQNFGVVTGTQNQPRQLQLGLKFYF